MDSEGRSSVRGVVFSTMDSPNSCPHYELQHSFYCILKSRNSSHAWSIVGNIWMRDHQFYQYLGPHVLLKQENIETVVMHRHFYFTLCCVAGLMSSIVVWRMSTPSDFTLTEWYHTRPHAGHQIIALEAKVRLERASCLCVPNAASPRHFRGSNTFFLKDDYILSIPISQAVPPDLESTTTCTLWCVLPSALTIEQ